VGKAIRLLDAKKRVGVAQWRYEVIRVNHQPVTVAGTDFGEVGKTRPYWRISGSLPAKGGEMLIGQDVALNLQLKTGDIVRIGGQTRDNRRFSGKMRVSGVVKTGGEEDTTVFMDGVALGNIMQTPGEIHLVELSLAAPGAELQQIEKQLEQHVPEVVPRIVKRISRSETIVLSRLQALVLLVMVVMLLLTLIGVAATMMSMVMERRKEIGLKKAVGAENSRIVAEFLGEGVLLGLCGGILGAISGCFFAQQVAATVFGRDIAFNGWLLLVTILMSLVVTVIACILPIRHAVGIDPAWALRGE
jgi:putative ABC transport system permease protein